MQCPADYGTSFWRLLWPQLIINMRGLARVGHSQMFIRDLLQYRAATAIHIQRQTKLSQLDFFKKVHDIKKRMSFRLIYDIDDVIFTQDMPDYNLAKRELLDQGVYAKEIMELCDEITVSTPFLRDYYLKNTNQKNISVLPNCPPPFLDR